MTCTIVHRLNDCLICMYRRIRTRQMQEKKMEKRELTLLSCTLHVPCGLDQNDFLVIFVLLLVIDLCFSIIVPLPERTFTFID